MSGPDRRSFLKLLGAAAAATTLQESISKALALPANNTTESIKDVQNIVIFMQENRSFDHYFGGLSGVRGFGDPRAVMLPGGQSVWHQPHGSDYVLPFRPSAPRLGLQFLQDLAHDWNSTHHAWNRGYWDSWVAAKSAVTMVHFAREDIPFHYALADAFTVCDAYHCSVLGPTYPNRNYMFTGWTGNDGQGYGPQLDTNSMVCDWPTYPERLEAAGVSWKIYQDVGAGLTAAQSWGDGHPYIGNSANNTLLRFQNYQTAPDRSPLAVKARTGTNISVSGTLFDNFRRDVANGTLPQVSWLMCPNAYDEHPNWPSNYGAWFISKIMDILTSNPDVWSKTAFFITYDENDGLFDHVVSPTPPQSSDEGASTVSIENEIFEGNSGYVAGPFGLGPRVPMLVISPWSKGGWVNSEVFCHASLIRFIEERFGDEYPDLIETQITPWRRAVVGDLTSAFDFKNPNSEKVSLPSTVSYIPPDTNSHPSMPLIVPASQVLPTQESGVRPARAMPYNLHVQSMTDQNTGSLNLEFINQGSAGAVFHARDYAGNTVPRSYTVEQGKTLAGQWPATTAGLFNLAVYGPNGFYRSFCRNVATGTDIALSTSSSAENCTISITLINKTGKPVTIQVEDVYSGQQISNSLAAGKTHTFTVAASATSGWYDILINVAEDAGFELRIAGHVETGEDSTTDPAIGKVAF
ncbi:phosphocholine-specific phospholipase C [Acetobacter fallax]|uniref:phospholipase C n=1 Tax=Acetobacter fallax TaxID=1737473 RepID=A0ABX0KE63_9PROT|nr:phospholipase C, phosphocholine-specific [Acetobacter fallax]NHO34103.1 phospholipase C, phosphocholine-specific [Acetobacter fallax]NHO37629.1 phospholipase C, phosphocholine-specific [Acetobacter fallax]